MTTRQEIRAAISTAQARQRCLRVGRSSEHSHLYRMMQNGEVIRPYPNMYAESQYWSRIDPREQMMHVIHTLADHHPKMVFAGLSAACVWGLEHSFHLYQNDNRIVLAASANTPAGGYCNLVRRLYVPQCEIEQACDLGGIKVTSVPRTLFDCGRLYEYRSALSFFDSALRRGLVTKEDIVRYCDQPRRGRNQHQALSLARLANGLSENGGESFSYATIYEAGLMLPEQQVEFTDARNPSQTYRVDYLWRLANGQIIVGEFDGQQKYTDATMTGGQTIRGVVAKERDRTDALLANGVTKVVRWFFNDVVRRTPMINKLMTAGVPRSATRLMESVG